MTNTEADLDLSTCANEPIHIPGAIQPYGVVLVVDEQTLTIVQGSDNTEPLFKHRITGLIGRTLAEVFEYHQYRFLDSILKTKRPDDNQPAKMTMYFPNAESAVEVSVRRTNDAGLILEFEVETDKQPTETINTYATLNQALTDLPTHKTQNELFNAFIRHIRKLTGFDRVMLYKFDEQYNGSVIAEDCQVHLQPFLGLHYPASDIPAQARLLYARNYLRYIPDVNYSSVPLIPLLNPINQAPLDLSFCMFRAVSPIHIEYLQNMGVQATLTLSVMINGTLWGLVACHHYSPHLIAQIRRNACQTLLLAFNGQLEKLLESEMLEAKLTKQKTLLTVFENITDIEQIWDTIFTKNPNLLQVTESDGGAVFFDQTWHLFGKTPTQKECQQLLAYVQNHSPGDIYLTESLGQEYPEAVTYYSRAAGLLSVPLNHNNHLFFFRLEEPQTINWAGEPTKFFTNDQGRISPRKSFDLWRQVRLGIAKKWKPEEVEVAIEVRNFIINTAFSAAKRLNTNNKILTNTIQEQNQLLYLTTHEVKTFFEVIRDISQNLEQTTPLNDEQAYYVNEVIALAEAAKKRLESIYSLSQVKTVTPKSQVVSVQSIVEHTLVSMYEITANKNITFKIEQTLPDVVGDALLITALFYNAISLLANTNTASTPVTLHIGAVYAADLPVFFLRQEPVLVTDDTEIRSMRVNHSAKNVLDTEVSYLKRLIELHGGKLWIDQANGLTIRFTLNQN